MAVLLVTPSLTKPVAQSFDHLIIPYEDYPNQIPQNQASYNDKDEPAVLYRNLKI